MRIKILQINVIANSGSTGKIAEKIGRQVLKEGWESYIAYGRWACSSQSQLIKIGNKIDIFNHVIGSRLLDKHGCFSTHATKILIKKIKEINPDIIHLHNIHGYFLNYKILFDFLSQYNKPIVWTLHDCWSFTGHCSHYTAAKCNKWQTQCFKCPIINSYPKSFIDNSKNNYTKKKVIFTQLQNLHIVTVSDWLHNQVSHSFLKNYPIHTICNGINLNTFKPTVSTIRKKLQVENKFIILSVASYWNNLKGLDDFIKLANLLDDKYVIILVGIKKTQLNMLPKNIIGIPRTENVEELVDLYSAADIYASFSIEETFGMTIAESMACGTPAIVYNSTACPELVTDNTGFIITPHDLERVIDIISKVKKTGKNIYSPICRKHIETCFAEEKTYTQYLSLYKKLLNL